MKLRLSFDDALDAAIDDVRRGEPIAGVLARYPGHASALRPVLEAAQAASRHAATAQPPRSEALVHNYAILRAAVERASMAPALSPADPPTAGWRQRRLRFASVTVPAGTLALLAVLGVSGAAASVALTTQGDLPGAIASFVESPHIPGSNDDSGTAPPGASQGDGKQPMPAVAWTAAATQASANRPTIVTDDGVISGIRGATFTLTTADGEVQVNLDANTSVDGVIAEGASATVSGDITAEKNLHATSVLVTAAPPAAPVRPEPTAPGNSGEVRTPAPPARQTPTAISAEPTATPPPEVTVTPSRTPGPPPDRTPGPPRTRTPQGGNN